MDWIHGFAMTRMRMLGGDENNRYSGGGFYISERKDQVFVVSYKLCNLYFVIELFEIFHSF